MKTKIIKLNLKNLKLNEIKKLAEIIKNGGLVAFPTETVYGIGANALDEKAINKIFLVKGRPGDNPLIVHICSKKQLHNLAKKIPIKAVKLVNKFWPGPLTIILNKKENIPNNVTANLPNVAVRMPNNKIALNLIKFSGVPIAAPSANISGKPSPTQADHVIEDLTNKVDAIIDGGRTNIGIESTVIDLTKDPPIILRPGKITKEQIEKVIGNVKESKNNFIRKPLSPGMKYKHYSPKAKVIIKKNKKEMEEFCKKFKSKKVKKLVYANKILMARNLFRDFRYADKKGYEIILVKEIGNSKFGKAIMDRLKKASS